MYLQLKSAAGQRPVGACPSHSASLVGGQGDFQSDFAWVAYCYAPALASWLCGLGGPVLLCPGPGIVAWRLAGPALLCPGPLASWLGGAPRSFRGSYPRFRLGCAPRSFEGTSAPSPFSTAAAVESGRKQNTESFHLPLVLLKFSTF